MRINRYRDINIRILIPSYGLSNNGESYYDESRKLLFDSVEFLSVPIYVSNASRPRVQFKPSNSEAESFLVKEWLEFSLDSIIEDYTLPKHSEFAYKSEKLNYKIDYIDNSFQLYSSAESFTNEVINFLRFFGLARPGFLNFGKGKVILNDSEIPIRIPSVINLSSAFEEASKLKWPELYKLNFKQVSEWYCANNFNSSRLSRSKLETAFNAYTHLFNYDEIFQNTYELFWSLLGIESLYCSENASISKQIIQNTQLFLGEQVSFKKSISKMYDFRSRFIHGDLFIPPLNDNIIIDDDKFSTHLKAASSLATAILIATIQKMIIEDRKELNFKYILD